MSLRDGLQEEAVVGHGIVDAWSGNHKSSKTAEDAKNNDCREDDSARGTEENFASLCDKGAVRADFFDGHEINEDCADHDVDDGDGDDAQRQRPRQGATRIANFTRDFGSVPPAPE